MILAKVNFLNKINKKKKIIISDNNSIFINNSEINYAIEFSRRKSISIIINKYAEIKIKAPLKIPKKYIEDFIIKKSSWIIKKRDFFIKNKPPEEISYNFENGSYIKLLGENYQIIYHQNLISKIEINHNNKIILFNYIKLPEKNKLIIKIENFINEFAINYFNSRLKICSEIAREKNIIFNKELKFRKMKTKWGSCSRNGEIKLSYNLIQAPQKAIDYVILHELCHLKEFNHSKNFYNLLESLMPDWKIHKMALRGGC